MKKYIYFSIFLSILIGLYLKIYDSINDDDVEVLEVEVLKGLYSSSIKSKWINITVENEIWETHLLESSYIDQNKPNILLLHGYGATSAITWRVTIPGLVEKFNVLIFFFFSIIMIIIIIIITFIIGLCSRYARIWSNSST